MSTSDDFEFILEPGKYWFVAKGPIWIRYRRVLKDIFGKESFKTVKTEDQSVRVQTPEGVERKVLATWVVLEVKTPIAVSAEMMGAPHKYFPGDSAQSTGAFEVPEPHWIVTASEYAMAVQSWGESVVEGAAEFAEDSAEFAKNTARRVAQEVSDIAEKPLKAIETRALKVAVLLGVGALGAYAIYKIGTKG